LRAHGLAPLPLPLDQFIKAGGAAKCLTLRL
jgi:N-dimethylarginine dimethylaminohydrolase